MHRPPGQQDPDLNVEAETDSGAPQSLGRLGIVSSRNRFATIQEPLSHPGEKPMGMGTCDLDQAQNRVRWDRTAALVVMKSPKRDLQRLGKHRTTVNAIKGQPDLPDPLGQTHLENVPFRLSERLFHEDGRPPSHRRRSRNQLRERAFNNEYINLSPATGQDGHSPCSPKLGGLSTR